MALGEHQRDIILEQKCCSIRWTRQPAQTEYNVYSQKPTTASAADRFYGAIYEINIHESKSTCACLQLRTIKKVHTVVSVQSSTTVDDVADSPMLCVYLVD